MKVTKQDEHIYNPVTQINTMTHDWFNRHCKQQPEQLNMDYITQYITNTVITSMKIMKISHTHMSGRQPRHCTDTNKPPKRTPQTQPICSAVRHPSNTAHMWDGFGTTQMRPPRRIQQAEPTPNPSKLTTLSIVFVFPFPRPRRCPLPHLRRPPPPSS